MRQMKGLFSTLIDKPTVVFILGGPCSGKGTQSTLMSNHLQFKHLSAGELLREQRKRPQSRYGQLIQQTIVKGMIVPSRITVSLLQAEMKKSSKNQDRFLIDGFPRNIQNLQKWDQLMGFKVVTPFIIYLKCSQQTMIKRLSQRSKISNRSDDNLQVMKKRLRTFNEQTMPVIHSFEKSGRVIQASAQGSAQKIFNQLKESIKRKNKQQSSKK